MTKNVEKYSCRLGILTIMSLLLCTSPNLVLNQLIKFPDIGVGVGVVLGVTEAPPGGVGVGVESGGGVGV